MRTRSKGLGNQVLIAGNDTAGYYGKYQGIATPNEIITLGAITEGTTKDDDFNDPTLDITWLKFSHNYKTLFVADRTIHYAISWNHLELKELVFGKVVTIDGQKYLLRLMQGANINPPPFNVSGGAESNDEWDSLIVAFTPDTADSHWLQTDPVNNSLGDYTRVQETPDNNINNSIIKGRSAVDGMTATTKASISDGVGYRPVLEVL